MSKSINSNKQFMVGNGILAFGVFFIVCLFLYLGFRFQKKDGEQAFQDIYTVCVEKSMAGNSISVYINDSLLMNQTMTDADRKFQVRRFAEESMLMVVDNQTEEITPFNLNPKGSLIRIQKKNGKIFIEETEATTDK